jgi:hypothetical protein
VLTEPIDEGPRLVQGSAGTIHSKPVHADLLQAEDAVELLAMPARPVRPLSSIASPFATPRLSGALRNGKP